MATSKKLDLDESTLRTMGALLRMPPKPHDEMKLGKPHNKPQAAPKRKSKKAKPSR